MSTMQLPKKVLIIDDEEHFAQVLGRSLERFGHTTTYAINADEAIEQLSSKKFDWISLDLRLG